MITDRMWKLLQQAPESQIEPKLKDELISLGQDPKTVDFALIIQKCVRYGQSSDFIVMVLSSILMDLCGDDRDLYTMNCNMAAAILIKEETGEDDLQA